MRAAFFILLQRRPKICGRWEKAIKRASGKQPLRKHFKSLNFAHPKI